MWGFSSPRRIPPNVQILHSTRWAIHIRCLEIWSYTRGNCPMDRGGYIAWSSILGRMSNGIFCCIAPLGRARLPPLMYTPRILRYMQSRWSSGRNPPGHVSIQLWCFRAQNQVGYWRSGTPRGDSRGWWGFQRRKNITAIFQCPVSLVILSGADAGKSVSSSHCLSLL